MPKRGITEVHRSWISCGQVYRGGKRISSWDIGTNKVNIILCAGFEMEKIKSNEWKDIEL